MDLWCYYLRIGILLLGVALASLQLLRCMSPEGLDDCRHVTSYSMRMLVSRSQTV